MTAGRFVYIRYFENLVGMLLGQPPEACGMLGICSQQYVVEADGGVYPCDFYVLDEYRLGSLVTDSFDALDARRDGWGLSTAPDSCRPSARAARGTRSAAAAAAATASPCAATARSP